MTKYCDYVKEKLNSIIKEMGESSEYFVKNPGKDFVRNRKLSFETVMKLLLSMGESNIYKELLDYFKYDIDTATASAFVQQRAKILPKASEHLFNTFTNSFHNYKKFNGYRLLAADGSNLNIAHNPKDSDTYIKCGDIKEFNVLHLNAPFDLCNKVYIDAGIQPIKKQNERFALNTMVDRADIGDNVIVIADREYESYNNFAHIQEKGWKYNIIVKDKDKKGMVSSFAETPSCEIFDKRISIKRTRKQTKKIKADPTYKFLPSNVNFDYLEQKSSDIYLISLRIVRFKISQESYETIIFTNAIHICMYFFRRPDDEYPPDVEALIQKNILPVRKGRKDLRKIRSKSSVSFIYRVA